MSEKYKMYHGSYQIIKSIDLSKGRPRTDFGKGFYLGTNLGVAKNWALIMATGDKIPTVMMYEVDGILFKDVINTLEFKEPSIEWLEFIKENRQRISQNNTKIEPRHDYDVVRGPIADDKVAFVVKDYIDKKISAEEAIKRARAMPSVMQYSFHTPKALSYIGKVYYSQYKNGKWTDWTA